VGRAAGGTGRREGAQKGTLDLAHEGGAGEQDAGAGKDVGGAMRRRLFCLGVGALACGGLLAACGVAADTSSTFDPDGTYARLDTLDVPGLTNLIAAASPQGQEITRGLYLYYGQREVDSFDAPTVAYMLAPGYHRLSYHVFETDEFAARCYADFVTGYLIDPRPPLAVPTGFPYPAILLESDERGVAVVQIGRVVLSVIAAGTNPGFVTTLTLGGTAHLERLLALAV